MLQWKEYQIIFSVEQVVSDSKVFLGNSEMASATDKALIVWEQT